MASFYNYNNSLYGKQTPSYGHYYGKSLNVKQNDSKPNALSPFSSSGQMMISNNRTNYHYLQQQTIADSKVVAKPKDDNKENFTNTVNKNFFGMYDNTKKENTIAKDAYSMINNFEQNHIKGNNQLQQQEPKGYKVPTPLVYGVSSAASGVTNTRFGFNYGSSNLYNTLKNNAFYKQQEEPYYSNNPILSNRTNIGTPYQIPKPTKPSITEPLVTSIKSPVPKSKIARVCKVSSLSRAGADYTGTTKTNQDSYLNKTYSQSQHVFGVFDGHGYHGHFVSQAIKQFFNDLPFTSLSSPTSLQSSFATLSSQVQSARTYDSNNSGSTCVLVSVDSTTNKMYCANCGDSRAILITATGNIIALSRDHKPDLFEEKKRIEQQGGRVDRVYGMGPYRVWLKNENYPGLAMSRSIGDGVAHSVGVSDLPEIKEFDMEKVEPLAMIVSSDGVWEFMSNEDVKGIVEKYYYNKDSEGCANEIVQKSLEKWQYEGYAVDDITTVVVFFE